MPATSPMLARCSDQTTAAPFPCTTDYNNARLSCPWHSRLLQVRMLMGRGIRRPAGPTG
jgi:hypothetical protein